MCSILASLLLVASCSNDKSKAHFGSTQLEAKAIRLIKTEHPDSLSKALQFLDKAIDMTPDQYRLHADKAYIYSKQKNYTLSEKAITRAIELKDGFAEGFLMKGILLKKMRNDSAAVVCFEEAYDLYTERIEKRNEYSGSSIINRWVVKYLIVDDKEVVLTEIENSKYSDEVKRVATAFISDLSDSDAIEHLIL